MELPEFSRIKGRLRRRLRRNFIRYLSRKGAKGGKGRKGKKEGVVIGRIIEILQDYHCNNMNLTRSTREPKVRCLHIIPFFFYFA